MTVSPSIKPSSGSTPQWNEEEIAPNQRMITCWWTHSKERLEFSSSLTELMEFIEELFRPADLFREFDEMISAEFMIRQKEGIFEMVKFPFICMWLLMVTVTIFMLQTLCGLVMNPVKTAHWICSKLNPGNIRDACGAMIQVIRQDIASIRKTGLIRCLWNLSLWTFHLITYLFIQVMFLRLISPPFETVSRKISSLIPSEAGKPDEKTTMAVHIWRIFARPWSARSWHERWQKSRVWRNNQIWDRPISEDSTTAFTSIYFDKDAWDSGKRFEIDYLQSDILECIPDE